MPASFEDILYDKRERIGKITINRADKLNTLRPRTTEEITEALNDAGDDSDIGVIVITGAGDRSFCAGGDLSGGGGAVSRAHSELVGFLAKLRRLHWMIRNVPKPVIAMVNGYAIGAGHVMHVVCDLTIASENAKFGQAGPRIGSFDGGFGAAYLSRVVGEKKAREMWFLCRRYSAQNALEMGLVNKVVPADKLEEETMNWCTEILSISPTALKMLKLCFNADSDSIYGLENMASGLTEFVVTSDEGVEGHKAWVERRAPDFYKYKKW